MKRKLKDFIDDWLIPIAFVGLIILAFIYFRTFF